jgi:hypothetical protein
VQLKAQQGRDSDPLLLLLLLVPLVVLLVVGLAR